MGKIKAGDILLFSGDHWISRVIQWGTGSRYNHVGVCVDPDTNLMIDAAGRVRAEDMRRERFDVFRVRSGHQYDLDKVISYLVDKLNRPYDYIGVIYLGALKLLRLKKWSNRWQRENDYFCSELVKSAFQAGGLELVPGMTSGTVSPADIAESPVVKLVLKEL